MAESLSHKFGQIIGDLLELAVQPILEQFAKDNSLYLDKKGKRVTRKGKKLTWTDLKENKHDLDFVLERNGTDDTLGDPVAFIETAWRRYTKHSRNKAQEIQGAIIPLSEKYRNSSPFLGVVLAGVFTEGALTQLKSNGFGVLYFPYETVVAAFAKFGIDAAFGENTPEDDFRIKVQSWEQLQNKSDVARELLALNKKEVDDFFADLLASISRYIESVFVFPLHGKEFTLNTVQDAIEFLKEYTEEGVHHPIIKYEIIVRYNTGDKIDASFKDKKNAIDFLQKYI